LILSFENIIRLSDDAFDLFERIKDKDIEFHLDNDKSMIIKALLSCGYNPMDDDSLKAYQLATAKYINDAEVRNAVVWMKYDKCKIGKLSVGDKAITNEIYIYNLKGEKISLNEILSDNKPNVIVSGSISWPPFSGCTLSCVNRLYSAYRESINIFAIYISEAHAKDEWPLSKNDMINQHKTIEKRISAAKMLNASFPVYCDDFESNNFENIYSGWPERAFIIYQGEIKFISYHKVDGYDNWHGDVEKWIAKYLNK